MAAQTESGPKFKSTLIDRVARVELRVRDVDAALGFYRDVAGLEVTERNGNRAALRSGDGPVILVLDAEGVTAPAVPGATGLFHTAFRFPTRDALGDGLARVTAAGLQVGAGDHVVSEALYVDDPDGNGVELYWDRPREQWPAPTGEALIPMATLPVDLDGLYRAGRAAAAVGEPAPPGTDVGHVHLQVSDIDETIAFYRDVLGLDLIARMGASAGFFSSKGYHHNIGTNTWRSRGSKRESKEHAGLERVAFAVTDPGELEALRRRLDDAGRRWTEDGSEVVVRDPDGIELRFSASV